MADHNDNGRRYHCQCVWRLIFTIETSQRLNELAAQLGMKQAKDLELLATTLYVVAQGFTATEDIIGRVGDLKPQFERERIELAIAEVGELKSAFFPA
jgi:hypothetical protein